MADFYVTADGGSFTEIEPVAKAIEAEGFTVETGQKGPNAEAIRNQGIIKPPTKLVFICNGGLAGQTYGSFALNYQEGMSFTIFAFDNYRSHFSTTTEDALKTQALVSEHDSDDFATDEIARDFAGHTTCSYQAKHPDVFAFVTDETSAENLGKKIAHGQYTCGSGDSAPTSSSGGGAQIKDKTFEACIRRICAATDSVFLVENNAAILFPYTDWMAFILKAKIQDISANEMDPDIFEMEYNTEGFYNRVVGWWGDVEVPERYIEDENGKIVLNKETKAKVINSEEPITTTEGDVTTETTNTISDGVQIAKQYDPLVNIYGVLEKRVTTPYPNEETANYALNALLNQYVRDFNNTCRVRTLNTQKYIGGTFYTVENPFNKEKTMFYLNGYTTKTQDGEPLYIDLDFRYGPEGAEELLDYQILTGGTGSGVSGPKGDEKAIWTEAAKIHYGHNCSSQDPEEAYQTLHGHEGEDDCSADCYGMSSYLYYRFNNEANIPCQVVGDTSHHVVMLDRGSGFEETRNEYRSYGFEYLFKWKEDQPTTVVLAAPGQNANTQNDNSKNVNAGGNT